jgi:hypothetical protein
MEFVLGPLDFVEAGEHVAERFLELLTIICLRLTLELTLELFSEFGKCVVLGHFSLRQDLSLNIFEYITSDSYDCRFDLSEFGLSFFTKIGEVL